MEGIRQVRFPSSDRHFFTSIGMLDKRTRLCCSINVKDKSTTYYRTRKQAFQIMSVLGGKVKRWAFNRLKEHGRSGQGQICGDFLPGELLRGNGKVIPEFLRRLKEQRVESYIKFRWSQKQPPRRTIGRMAHVFSNLVQKKRREGFKKIIEKGKEGEKMRIIEAADTSVRSLSDFLFSTPERSTARSLNVTLIKVSVTPEKAKERSFCREAPKARQGRCIDMRDLQRSSDRKEYRFSSADSRWRRVKVNNCVHRI